MIALDQVIQRLRAAVPREPQQSAYKDDHERRRAELLASQLAKAKTLKHDSNCVLNSHCVCFQEKEGADQ